MALIELQIAPRWLLHRDSQRFAAARRRPRAVRRHHRRCGAWNWHRACVLHPFGREPGL